MRGPGHTLPRLEDRLIVALDVPTIDDARHLVDTLGDAVTFYKLGMWLLFQPGAHALIAELTEGGKNLFLDYKLYDIGETVRHGTASIARLGARFLTVHGEPAIMRAAVEGATGSSLGILAVTVLTSLDDAALHAMGSSLGVRDVVMRRTREAAGAGCAGVIASAADDPNALRETAGRSDLLVVTPGIRMPDDDAGDQRRTATPGEAIRRGADFIVVGRPIVRAVSPRDAARRVLADMGTG